MKTCECTDPGCPCSGRCKRKAIATVYRVDMEDVTGTDMCDRCMGVFTTEPDEDD